MPSLNPAGFCLDYGIHFSSLVEVASPVVLTLYDYHERAKTLGTDEFVEAIELLESFVFRRSVCDMQTRSLGQIFASLAYRITEIQRLLSLRVALYRQGKKRERLSKIRRRIKMRRIP